MEIKLRDLECRLTEEKAILKDINLDIIENHIYGIIGPKGSGKTTLLEVICGIKPIYKGELIISNFNKNIGLVSGQNNFIMETIEKELNQVLIDKNILDKSLIIKSLNMVGLNKYYLNKNPNEISFSEKILLSLSKALICAPKLLLLDDITMGLDKFNKKHLLTLLKRLKQNHKVTILMATNDIDFINLIADNIIVLDHGKIIASAKTEDVFKKDNLLNKRGIGIPKILEFINKVEDDKKIKLGNYDDVKDLIKAVYRNV